MTVMSFFRGHWHDAAVRDLASLVLKLNGGVMNAKLLCQALLHFAQDGFAGRRRNVGDSDVAGQGMHFRSDAPHVEVVYVAHAVYLLDRVG